jgi:dissimilatory sulfite reductase (desulfoviridin) alpha/beta subunit
VRACRTGALTVAARGWRVLVGGQLGRHPRLAETWFPFADGETVRKAFVTALEFRLAESSGARLGETLNRTGLAALQSRFDAIQ